jgi:hypothetical protein
MSSEHFSPAQVRGARGLLAWSVAKLARRSGLRLHAIEAYEAERGGLSDAALQRLSRTLSGAGAIPIPAMLGGEGVRLARPRRAAIKWTWS